MAATDNIYFDYYSSESLSRKWDFKPPIPSRRIQIIPPNAIDTKSSSVGGPPAYHPSSMSYTQQKLFRQKLLYVAPLAYYAIRTLRPWCFGIDSGDETLSAWVLVSTAEGEQRVNLGDVIAPWAKGNISLLDPPTWAFLIRLYNGLPEHYSRYKLALNDPYLPMLSAIPSTPKFSVITVLDLSSCDDLHDSNISQLKILASLCVLDTSCTHLTDLAVSNLASTLLLQEPGPLRLQSWSLRGCADVTNRSIESLGYFPMLCLLDLRGTSVEPQPLLYRLLNWDRSTVKSPRDHLDFFWPQPQSSIPVLIQDLKRAAYPTRTGDHESSDKPQRPWIIHIDRQYPSNWGLHRIPHWKPAQSNNCLPWYSNDYSDIEEDRLFSDADSFYVGSGSDISFGTEQGDLSDSPGEFDPSSPLGPTSSVLGDNETSTSPRVDPTWVADGMNDTISSDASDSNASNSQSAPRRTVAMAVSQSSPIHPDQILAGVIVGDSPGHAPGVLHFYNARAQAGLAPPNARKRRKIYYSASSESYDSDEEREIEEEMEAELRKRRIESLSDRDWQLMLLREPPEWTARETLIATVRTRKQRRSQNVPTQPDLSSAKKRKIASGEMAALWAQIRASSKPSQSFSQSITPHHNKVDSSATNSQTPLITQSPSTKGDGTRVRRTTLGRAPRPPGTIARKAY